VGESKDGLVGLDDDSFSEEMATIGVVVAEVGTDDDDEDDDERNDMAVAAVAIVLSLLCGCK
jgi:hypothetical protein